MDNSLKKIIDADIDNFAQQQSHLLKLIENIEMSANTGTVNIRSQMQKLDDLQRLHEMRLKEEEAYLEQLKKDHESLLDTLKYAKDALGIKTTIKKELIACHVCKRKFDKLKGMTCPHCGSNNSIPLKEEKKVIEDVKPVKKEGLQVLEDDELDIDKMTPDQRKELLKKLRASRK